MAGTRSAEIPPCDMPFSLCPTHCQRIGEVKGIKYTPLRQGRQADCQGLELRYSIHIPPHTESQSAQLNTMTMSTESAGTELYPVVHLFKLQWRRPPPPLRPYSFSSSDVKLFSSALSFTTSIEMHGMNCGSTGGGVVVNGDRQMKSRM